MTEEKDFFKSPEADFDKIGRKADVGIRWSSISIFYSALLQFIMLIVLAQLLSPKEYGIMGIVLIVLGFGTLFSDIGVSGAIIHFQNASKEQISTLYWLSFIIGLIIFIMLFLLSPFIALFYNEPSLTYYIQIIAIIFLIIPIGQQFEILLRRELVYRSLSFTEIVDSTFLTISSIVLAFYGLGVASIVIGYILKYSVRSLLLVIIGRKIWKPIFILEFSDIKKFLSFGLYQMGERSVNFLNQNLAQILIGKFLGTVALGYYTFAYNLVSYPITLINPIFTRVSFPYFAKLQNNVKILKEKYLNLLSLVSFINFPVYLLLILIAPNFVPLIYGSQWYPSIILVQILSLVFIFRSVSNPVGSLLLAKGHAKLGFLWNVFVAIIYPFFVILGIYLGSINYVAISILFSRIILFYFFYRFLIKKSLGSCFKEYMKSFGIFLLLSGFSLLIGFLGGFIFQSPSNLFQVLYYTAIMIILYLCLILIFKRSFFIEFIRRFLIIKSKNAT